MGERLWLKISVAAVTGALLGGGAVVASTEVNRWTSTDTFCTSCHSMAVVANDPYYRQSAHRTNNAGVLAGCSDCHIPTDNWFVETYTHVIRGVTDVVAESTGNFSDPAAWSARRKELADRARNEIRNSGNSTCRRCHDLSSIRPTSEAGRMAHRSPQETGIACGDCHANFVHARPAANTSSPPS
ncbi:MAG: NapC/NirT family cytochrome c [Burkholderiaceae bacterium]